MLRRMVRICTIAICMGSVVPALAQQTTHLDAANQGQGNKGTSFRPVDSTGNPSAFVLTGRSRINPAAPLDPAASGSTGTVAVDKAAKGTGVQNANLGGSKGISGGGGDQNEELVFTFDSPLAASSITIYIVGLDVGSSSSRHDDEGSGPVDNPVLFFSEPGTSAFGHTILPAEVRATFVSVSSGVGQVDFSMLPSLGAGLQIDSFKLRETTGHIAVIRIVHGSEVTGACCFENGGSSSLASSSCEILSEADCAQAGGRYLGDDTTCDQCPPLVGACCMSDGVCHEISDFSCGVLGGNFLGVGTTCADCPPVTGACCIQNGDSSSLTSSGDDGSGNGSTCEILSEADCAQAGGNYLGDDTTCDQCPPLVGACCMSDGVCHEISDFSCGVLGGNFLGVGTTCADCPPVTGACCQDDGSCTVISEADCSYAGGNFLGVNTSCSECPPISGACCFSDGRQCVEISDLSCGILGGVFQGGGVTCAQAECPIIPDCNENGTADSQDISSGTSKDCNNNDIPDECEIDVNSTAPGGPFFCTSDCDPDCNNNGIPDECDISDCDGSPGCQDCNGNSIPDECEVPPIGNGPDCNNNGVPDECDINNCDGSPGCQDCNGNGIPDECDIDGGTSPDCNNNGKPDECEIDVKSTAPGGPFFCTSNCDPDCNNNGIPDECDITDCDGSPECSDCNGNSIPDGCEVPPIGSGPDCNNNGIPDSCETDCNSNGVPDDCDVDPTDPDGNGQVSEDCDENMVPDECQPDTDGDGVIDPCDLCEGTATGDSVDTNGCAFITCDAGGPYSAVCDGGVVVINLQGSATGQVIPPPETELVVEWSTDCAGAVITNPNSEQATITIDTAVTGCPLACNITFTCSFVEIPGTQAFAAAAAGTGAPLPTGTSTGTIGLFLDCNGNLIDDLKDIADGTSQDCNGNGIPDECDVAQTDCNSNGVPDDCDIDPSDPDGNGQVSPDCNGNGIPDECDVPPIGTGADCNSNGVPDECDPDSDGNGVPDDCEPPPPPVVPPCDPNESPLSLLFTLLFHAPVCGMGCPSMLALTICGLMVMRTSRRRWRRRRSR